MSFEKGGDIRLRNEFHDSDGRRIFVEFPAFDLGAWLRALYFVRLYKKSLPVDLICVFESASQIRDFYEKCGGYMDSYSANKPNILCLMLYDLGKANKLFYCSDGSLRRNYIKR